MSDAARTGRVYLSGPAMNAVAAEAAQYGLTVEELIAQLLEGIREGLTRPGSWEAEHVEALAPYWREWR